MKRKNFLSEMWQFLWERKAYWIFPVTLFLIMLIVVLILGSSPVTGFIYPFF